MILYYTRIINTYREYNSISIRYNIRYDTDLFFISRRSPHDIPTVIIIILYDYIYYIIRFWSATKAYISHHTIKTSLP